MAGFGHWETARCRADQRGWERDRRGGASAYPEGPCRVASPRASTRQCAHAPPLIIGVSRPEMVKRLRGVEHPFGKAPQAPTGADHALQHGALDLHDPAGTRPRPDPVGRLADPGAGSPPAGAPLLNASRTSASMAGSARRFSTAWLRTRASQCVPRSSKRRH